MPLITVNSEPPKPTTFEDLGYVQVVRCKDCKWRGNKKMCIVAFVADKQEFPLFFYDNRGNWFCADGERKEVK